MEITTVSNNIKTFQFAVGFLIKEYATHFSDQQIKAAKKSLRSGKDLIKSALKKGIIQRDTPRYESVQSITVGNGHVLNTKRHQKTGKGESVADTIEIVSYKTVVK